MKSLTKKNIADKINNKIGISKLESNRIIDEFFAAIKNAVHKKGIVKLTHFGTFKLKKKKERVGRNPKTKETAVISSRRTVSFSPTMVLKNKINKKPL